jgi:hypothetical protein
VRRAVYEFRRQQTHTVNVVFDGYEQEVLRGAIDPGPAELLKILLGTLLGIKPGPAKDLTALSRFFEACIWKLSYPKIVEPALRTSGRREFRSTENIERLLVSQDLFLLLVATAAGSRGRRNPELCRCWP